MLNKLSENADRPIRCSVWKPERLSLFGLTVRYTGKNA